MTGSTGSTGGVFRGAAIFLGVATLRLLWGAIAPVRAAGEPMRELVSTRPTVSVREGATLQRDAWRLAPEAKPDVYEAASWDGRPVRVTFLTDVDSLELEVEVGRPQDFVIRYREARCWTRVVAVRVVPAAMFDSTYRAAHRGRIEVEVPEAYELVNVAIALTPTGLADTNLVYHPSSYHADVLSWFGAYRGDPAIAALDSVLRKGPAYYPSLKMNGYAFEFDRRGRLVPGHVYDRTGFPNERTNVLRPYLARLRSFADRSRFREFYRRHRATYAGEVRFFRATADVEGMRAWLERNFPRSSGYDCYKIVFSPLVAYNQSSTWLASNGFRELQAHVNYPYPRDVARLTHGAALSPRGEALLRGAIVFTELNHGYINPEAERYLERALAVTSRRDHWVDPAKGPGYYTGMGLFDEYMNWALVSLYAVDLAPAGDQPTLIEAVDDLMVRRRGFPRFRAFDAFLVELYRRRPAGATVADLYPRILDWFAAENDAAADSSDARGGR